VIASISDSNLTIGKDKAMGLTMMTALEIFTNPDDLEITIVQEKNGGKFAISIFRGIKHRYKPMLTSQPFAKTQKEAIKAIGEILQAVHNVSTREFENSESLVFQFLNPDSKEIDQSKILNQNLIERILEELRKNAKVSTCEMFTPPN